MEGLSKAALIKSLSPRVMLSNRLLPKGTKMKVNLEDQGRQKVSFSFAQTKKPLQSLFFIPASPDKSVTESPSALPESNSDKGQNTEDKTEQEQTSTVPEPIAETPTPQTPVSPVLKVKTDLSKMHFKKQILSVSVAEEKPSSIVPEENCTSELQVLIKSTSVAEFPTPQPQNVVVVCPSENAHTEASEAKVTSSLKAPIVSSGKDGESSGSTEQDNKVYKRKTTSLSDCALPGSESDGDSVQMSSSHKAVESKSKTKLDSRSKEVKKSSSGSNVEEKERSSSKRSENHERSSSYSKLDRDSRRTSARSSRSDRRRTRSRSRSRSRGSRTSSSHSRSERCRGSRSERSYYHDSDRRSHRSSPRRERRGSRSRTDRTRDSSDSEDDHRKMRTRTSDSSRLSNYSSSHKDSRSSSYLKSEKDFKSLDSSEMDKRTQLSKAERGSKRSTDSDFQRKCSPDPDSNYHKSSTHHKSETNAKSTSTILYTHSQTYERHQKSSSSDSDADHKGKSQASEISQKKTSRVDSELMTPSTSSVKTSGNDRQSNDSFQSPSKAPTHLTSTELCSPSEKEKPDSQIDSVYHRKEQGHEDVKEMDSSLDKNLQDESFKRTKERESSLDAENKNTSAIPSGGSVMHVNAALEYLTVMKDSLGSNNLSHISSDTAGSNSCSSDDSIVSSQDKIVAQCSLGPKSLSAPADQPVTQDVQVILKPDNIHQNEVVTIDTLSVTSAQIQSDSSCLEPENWPTDGKHSSDAVKKGTSTTKKSRWDIVGQDISDSDGSPRAVCAESKPIVKKVISVKKIEFSKDTSRQESSRIQGDYLREAETHSRVVKRTEISTQEISSDSASMEDACNDQSDPAQANTGADHCDFKLTVYQNTNLSEHPHMSNTSQVDNITRMQSWNGDGHEEKSKDSPLKSKQSKRASPCQDGFAGQSEASDSDNSEYDSDCGEAIKRLHSVVVVPKNSSITFDTHASSSSPVDSLEPQNANIARDLNFEAPNQASPQLQKNVSVAYQQTSGSCAGVNNSLHVSMSGQSQSNMIDSTSHSEGLTNAQLYMVGYNSATVNQNAVFSRDHSGQREQEHARHYVGGRDERMYSRYQQDDFSNADNINGNKGFSLGWDFSQAEQPSSTYQQPDSSHGPHSLNPRLSGISPMGQGHRQSNTPWTLNTPIMQTCTKPYLHAPERYQDPAGEIHPDSLTNDQGDYGLDKASCLTKTALECSGPNTPGSASFVQGHEISSNSRGSASEGSAMADRLRDDYLRPHRGRGPPKKRRPEIESDSDNEAEPGPAGKRERLRDTDVTKETPAKPEAPRPSLSLLDFQDASKWKDLSRTKKMPPYFDLIEENMYLTER